MFELAFQSNNTPAKFSGSATIVVQGRVVVEPNASAYAALKTWIQNTLTAKGWRVQSVSINNDGYGSNQARAYIYVTGSTSDNVNTVANFMAQQLMSAGIGFTGQSAQFVGASAGTITPTPTQTVPTNNTSYNTWTVRVDYTASLWTTLTFGTIENQLRADGWNVVSVVQTQSKLSGGIFDIKVLAFPQYNADAILTSMRQSLSKIGTVGNISIVSTAGGVIPVETPNPNQPASGDNGSGASSEVEKFLQKFGENLGFSAAGALVGGALVAVVVGVILFKK